MSEISAARVKELRQKTGAGMMDCKKALAESGGDLEAAVDWLRQKGLSAAAKKAHRLAVEGLIGVAAKPLEAAMVEVNSETDFVARNAQFREFVAATAEKAIVAQGDRDRLLGLPVTEGGPTLEVALTQLVAVIGENLSVRRCAYLSVSSGAIGAYLHSQQGPGVGRIGVLVALESEKSSPELADVGKKLAMHIAAANPQAISRHDVDPEALERERRVLTEQAMQTPKPEAIIQKMVTGRLEKFYADTCVLEQVHLVDGERKVQAVLDEAAAALGAPIRVTGFARFAVGETVGAAESAEGEGA